MSQGPRICLECRVFADLTDALELRDSWQCPLCQDRWRLGKFQDLTDIDRREYNDNTRFVKFLKGRE
jgi:hypothetical protein